MIWPQQPTNLKYKLKYEKFISACKNRILSHDEYFETHHIVPRSLGGTDDENNLVKLTAREHYIAHAMLWKMKFPGIYHAKMSYAFCTFIHGFRHKKHQDSYRFSSRLYETFKKNLSKVQSEFQSGEGNPFYGKTHSQETKEKISKYRKGKKLKDIFSPESMEKIRLANKNKVLTPEQKLKIKEGQKKYWANKENKEKRSLQSQSTWKDPKYREKMLPYIESRKGVPRDPKIIEKGLLSKKQKKEKGISYYSDEALANIRKAAKNRNLSKEYIENLRKRTSERFKGKKQTEESRRKRSESMKKTLAAKKAAGWVPSKRVKSNTK